MLRLSPWRIGVLAALFLLPVVVLVSVGFYALWQWGVSLWFSLGMMIFFGTAYFLAWRWQRKNDLLQMSFQPEEYWTARDKTAWQVVQAKAKELEEVPQAQLTDPQFYFNFTQDLGVAVAKVYHPKASDLYGTLTIPELLTCAELAIADLNELVQKYVPASHLVTINQLKSAKVAFDWFNQLNNVYWVVAGFLNPLETATRYATSKIAMATPMKKLQNNLLLWFSIAYAHRVGHYLIELHSRRLKVGAKRYRELLAQHQTPGVAEAEAPASGALTGTTGDGAAAPTSPVESITRITVAVVGQTKMGKSSLINALLGSNQAVTDVLPATRSVQRYTLTRQGMQLVMLDTVGYAHTGPKADQLAETESAAQNADVIVLVLHARNPGRDADIQMLDRLNDYFAARPDLHKPPIVAVLTHADLLSPAVEWSPPYDWKTPTRPKEHSIHQALLTAREQLGERVAGIVPVCLAQGKIWGVDEELIPLLTTQLSDAKSVALLRTIKNEIEADSMNRLLSQLKHAGLGGLKVLWESIKRETK
jgi:predicted GTPase